MIKVKKIGKRLVLKVKGKTDDIVDEFAEAATAVYQVLERVFKEPDPTMPGRILHEIVDEAARRAREES